MEPCNLDNQPAYNLRREERYRFDARGKYRRGTGRGYEVLLLDVSEYGCRFCDPVGKLTRGDIITVRMGSVGPIMAVVKWRDRHFVGIEFKQPLYPSVLDHIVAENSFAHRARM